MPEPSGVANCNLGFVNLDGKKLHIFHNLSVQFSCLVVSNSLRPRELQHTRPPCPSPTPRVPSNSHPSSRWCHSAISSSVVPVSSCPQSLPASESFPMSQLFAWGAQSTGASALASFPPKKAQGWSPLEWTGWISLQSKGLSRVFSNTTIQTHQFFGAQLSSKSNSHICTWPLENMALTRWTFVGKVISLLFNILSRLVIVFLPKSKHLLISWLQSPSAVILNYFMIQQFNFWAFIQRGWNQERQLHSHIAALFKIACICKQPKYLYKDE